MQENLNIELYYTSTPEDALTEEELRPLRTHVEAQGFRLTVLNHDYRTRQLLYEHKDLNAATIRKLEAAAAAAHNVPQDAPL